MRQTTRLWRRSTARARIAGALATLAVLASAPQAAAQCPDGMASVSGTVSWAATPWAADGAALRSSFFNVPLVIADDGLSGSYQGCAPEYSMIGPLSLTADIQRCWTPGCTDPGSHTGNGDPGDLLEFTFPPPPTPIGVGTGVVVDPALPSGYAFWPVSGTVKLDGGSFGAGESGAVDFLSIGFCDSAGNCPIWPPGGGPIFHYATVPLVSGADPTVATYSGWIGAGDIVRVRVRASVPLCPGFSDAVSFPSCSMGVNCPRATGPVDVDALHNGPIVVSVPPFVAASGEIKGHVEIEGLGSDASYWVDASGHDMSWWEPDPCTGALGSALYYATGPGDYDFQNLRPGTYDLPWRAEWTCVPGGVCRYSNGGIVVDVPEGGTAVKDLGLVPAIYAGTVNFDWLGLRRDDGLYVQLNFSGYGYPGSAEYVFYETTLRDIPLFLLLDSQASGSFLGLGASVWADYTYPGGGWSSLEFGAWTEISPSAGEQPFPEDLIDNLDRGGVGRWLVKGVPTGPAGVIVDSEWAAWSATVAGRARAEPDSSETSDSFRATLVPDFWPGTFNLLWYTPDWSSWGYETYELSVEVAAGDVVVQDFSGPLISEIQLAPLSGGWLELTATVTDPDGVASVRVNDQWSDIGIGGEVRARVEPESEMKITAEDVLGNKTTLNRPLGPEGEEHGHKH